MYMTFTQAEPYGTDQEGLNRFRELASWRKSNYDTENDPLRVLHMQRLLREAAALDSGDYIEMGTQHGVSAKIIFDLMAPGAHLFCFDTFTGFDAEDLKIESTIYAHGFTSESISDVDVEYVRGTILGEGKSSDRLTLVPGHVPQTLVPYSNCRWRFAHLDMDLYEPTLRASEWLWLRLVPGAIMLFHDYDTLPSIKLAVDRFSKPKGIVATPLSDRFGSAVLFKPLSKNGFLANLLQK